jgi:hypothetical protein
LGENATGLSPTNTVRKSAGRIEERYYDLIDAEDLPPRKKWTGCSSVGRITRKKTKPD